MNPGRMNSYLTYQLSTIARNALNEGIETWTDMFSCWGEVEPVSGREYFAGQAVQNDASIKIKVYHRRDISTRGRWTLGNRIFEITAVINVMEQNREIYCLCREKI